MKVSSCVLLAMMLIAGRLWSSVPVRTLAAPAVDAKIEVVWPHDEQGKDASVVDAPLVNVEVYLFERGTLNPVPHSFDNKVILRWAKNPVGLCCGQYGALVPAHDTSRGPGSAIGSRIIETVNGKTFPAWVFNDVPIEFVKDFQQTTSLFPVTTYFFVDVEGADVRSTVWAHGSDTRTHLYYDAAGAPINGQTVDVVDAMIQQVWPHDEAGNYRPVAEASKVNVGVDLFKHPEETSHEAIASDFNPPVCLLQALNNGYLEPVGVADQTILVTRTGRPWLRWVFNNVDVSAARDPLNKYYFAVKVDGVTTHTTIWAHGTDPRTYFPQKDVPTTSSKD